MTVKIINADCRGMASISRDVFIADIVRTTINAERAHLKMLEEEWPTKPAS